jgi:hypothetical protein
MWGSDNMGLLIAFSASPWALKAIFSIVFINAYVWDS